jgi:hypothetical protein
MRMRSRRSPAWLSTAFVVFALVAGVLPSRAGTPSREVRADLVARQSLALYRTGGLAALLINSEQCHDAISDKLYCIYMDIAAAQIDRGFTGVMGVNRHSYFDDPKFQKRTQPLLRAAGMGPKQAEAFLKAGNALIRQALAENAGM